MSFTPPPDALTITFPQPAPLLNMNSRQHWAVKAREVAAWRSRAFYAARSVPAVRRNCGPSFVMLTLPVPDRRRRDPANLFATAKPVVDGLVDGAIWPDDTPEWVTTIEPRLVVSRDRVVTVHIWPRGVPS